MDDNSTEETTEKAKIGQGVFREDMGPGSSLAHLYRGEMHRMKYWRERLDKTTNWAVVVMAAILTWAFSSESNPHYVLLVGMVAITFFLGVEARRYRGYDIWRTRVRLLQENVFAYALDEGESLPDPDWREKLSEDYRRPTMKLTPEQAVAHRLRRIYLPLFLLMLVAWSIRVTAFAGETWPTSASIGPVPGIVVSGVVAGFVLTLVVITVRPRSWKGELLEENPNAWDRHREF